MPRIDSWRALVAGIAGMFLLAGASAAVAAQGTAGGPSSTADVVDLGTHDIVISDVMVRLSDAHITGPGLPEKSIDGATYSIDRSSVSTDGVAVTVNDRTYRVGSVSVTVDDVGVTLENVSIGE